jgi:hypothetical protein
LLLWTVARPRAKVPWLVTVPHNGQAHNARQEILATAKSVT